MPRSKTFVLQWLDAVAAAEVPTAAKAVALAMATHADYGTGQNMRAGTTRLAHMAGLRDRQTRAMVKALKRAGLISWDGVPTAPGKARNYHLTVPANAPISDHNTPNGGSRVPPLDTDSTGNGGRRVPPSSDATVAIIDTNGGNNRQERRQPTATHQGPTGARPGRALRAATRADIESPLRIKLPELQCTPELVAQLRALLGRHRGSKPVRVEITDAAQSTVAKVLQLSDDLRVACSAALYADLKQLIGPDCLS